MKTAADLGSLKAHVGQDGVWYLDRAGHPCPSRMDVADFMRSDTLRHADCVRVIGAPENAGLIVALFDRKVRERLPSLQVVTPLVCYTQSERRDPATVLYHMRRFSRAPSQGGFHEVTEHDYLAYALAREVQMNGVSETALRLLRMHPAWKPLSFIPTLDRARCAELLAIVLDPRWFIDICRPDRAAKLNQYLGLNPRTQAAVTLNRPGKCRYRKRCELVLRCWKQQDAEEQVGEILELTGARPVEGSSQLGLRPGDFLWRRWGYLSGKGPGSRKPPKGVVTADLRASIHFVDFLRITWLHELYRGVPLPDGGVLFDADYFFKQDVVVTTAYDHYMRTRQ